MSNQVSVKLDLEAKAVIDQYRGNMPVSKFIKNAVELYAKELRGENTVATSELKAIDKRLEDSNRMLTVILNIATKISENQQKDILADVIKRVEEGRLE